MLARSFEFLIEDQLCKFVFSQITVHHLSLTERLGNLLGTKFSSHFALISTQTHQEPSNNNKQQQTTTNNNKYCVNLFPIAIPMALKPLVRCHSIKLETSIVCRCKIRSKLVLLLQQQWSIQHRLIVEALEGVSL